jgi:hypothetical protein
MKYLIITLMLLNISSAKANVLGDIIEGVSNVVKSVVEVVPNIITNPSDPLGNSKKTLKYGLTKLESAGNKVGKSAEDFVCGFSGGAKCNANVDFSAGSDGVQLGNQEPGYKDYLRGKDKKVVFEQRFQQYYNDHQRKMDEIRAINPDEDSEELFTPEVLGALDELAYLSLENAKELREIGNIELANTTLDNIDWVETNAKDFYKSAKAEGKTNEQIIEEIDNKILEEYDSYLRRQPASKVFDGSLADMNDLDSDENVMGGAILKGNNNGYLTTTKGWPKLKYEYNNSGKLQNRGWSKGTVEATVKHPWRIKPARDIRFNRHTNKRINQEATAYIRKDGNYVVVNNRTRDVVQISNIFKPSWKMDGNIKGGK